MYNTMNLISQLQANISGYEFQKSVNKYLGDKGVSILKTIDLLKILLYSQLSGKKSLRDICISLKSRMNYWYHLGLKNVSRNNLSHALMNRSNKIFEDTFYILLGKLQRTQKLKNDKRFKFKNSISSVDSTTISLCASMYQWAKFRKTKAGIKLHTQIDNRNQFPEFVHITNAKMNDAKAFIYFSITPGAIYVLDRGYFSLNIFNKILDNKAFFVTRLKTNTLYKKVKELNKPDGDIKRDWLIKFSGVNSKNYKGELRLVTFYDSNSKRTYDFITNLIHLAPKTIANIYKSRWDIELFFKWIKQNLKIKSFLGTTENAVLIQIWTALILYLLIKYAQYISRTSFTILDVFRILRENIFGKMSIWDLLNPKVKQEYDKEYESPLFADLCFL